MFSVLVLITYLDDNRVIPVSYLIGQQKKIGLKISGVFYGM
jgi:hypothetical protein